MLDQLSRLNSEHLTFLAVMAGLVLATLSVIASTLIVQIGRYRQRQLELGFREEMLRRGHSVHEVAHLFGSRRPTFWQSAAVLADRVKDHLADATRRLAEWTPQAIARLRKRLRPIWNKSVALCRRTWTKTRRLARQAWQDARPLIRRTRTAFSRCAAWLSDSLHQLSRRLAPNRP